VGSHAEQVDAASVDFDHEQDIEAAQADGVEMKEVGGEQACGLVSQEAAPVRVDSSWCRADPVGGDDASDRAFPDAVAEPGQFALDAAMAPSRVLLSEANNQLAQRALDSGTSYGRRVGPFSGDEAAVPGQQGCRCDESVGE
jgi:hypothetical protein